MKRVLLWILIGSIVLFGGCTAIVIAMVVLEDAGIMSSPDKIPSYVDSLSLEHQEQLNVACMADHTASLRNFGDASGLSEQEVSSACVEVASQQDLPSNTTQVTDSLSDSALAAVVAKDPYKFRQEYLNTRIEVSGRVSDIEMALDGDAYIRLRGQKSISIVCKSDGDMENLSAIQYNHPATLSGYAGGHVVDESYNLTDSGKGVLLVDCAVEQVPQIELEPIALITTGDSQGTGFFLGEGQVLTANHVVEFAETVDVTLSIGEIYTGKVVKRDLENDIALIEVDLQEHPVLQLAVAESSGQLEVWGYPDADTLGYDLKKSEVESSSEEGGELRLSVSVEGGSSGSPVVVNGEDVVGMVTRKNQLNGQIAAVDVEVLRTFLGE